MSLSAKEITQLKKLISIAEQLIKQSSAAEASASTKKSSRASGAVKRVRRTGKELVAFRKMLIAERKKGITASELSRTHGVSQAYIYQL
jgi:hypothetical protein